MKNSNNIIGNRPATFQFVNKSLNQLRIRVQEKQFFINIINDANLPKFRNEI